MPLLKDARARVLVPEKLSPDGLALLRSSLDVDERKGLSGDELLQIIPQYDALLVRSETKVTATVLRAARNLKVVARAGVGVDNVGKCLRYSLRQWKCNSLHACRCRGGYEARRCGRQLAFG